MAEVLDQVIDHRGKTPKKMGTDWADTGIQVISAKLVKNGRLDLDREQRFIDEEAYRRWMPVPLRAGDVLLTSEAPLGETAFMRLEVRLSLGQRLFALRANPEVLDPRFLHYYLQSPEGKTALLRRATGSTVFGIRQSALLEIDLHLPDIKTQRQVSTVLGSIDDLIDNNRRRIELLEEIARLLYREWFVNFQYPGYEDVPLVDSELGPIPEHWRVETLRDLAEVVKDTVDPASIPSGSPLVGLEHLPRRSTTLADWDLATEVGSRRATFRDGDVLFGKIRPHFHKVVEAPFSGYCSTDAVVLRPVRDSGSAHLLSVVSSDDFIAQASASANGTKMPRANMDVLMRYPIPRPTESVSQAFEEAVKPLTELAKQLIRTNSRLIEARDLLLPRLVSGDLDISDLKLDLETVG